MLQPCRYGYQVDSVVASPGQNGVAAGDVIVGILDLFLCGQSEEEIEARFGRAFANEAPLLVARYKELERAPLEASILQVERLLCSTSLDLQRTKSW